jgi:hypothetical protein
VFRKNELADIPDDVLPFSCDRVHSSRPYLAAT